MDYEKKARKRDLLSILESKYHRLQALNAKLMGEIERTDYEFEKLEEKRKDFRSQIAKLTIEDLEADSNQEHNGPIKEEAASSSIGSPNRHLFDDDEEITIGDSDDLDDEDGMMEEDEVDDEISVEVNVNLVDD